MYWRKCKTHESSWMQCFVTNFELFFINWSDMFHVNSSHLRRQRLTIIKFIRLKPFAIELWRRTARMQKYFGRFCLDEFIFICLVASRILWNENHAMFPLGFKNYILFQMWMKCSVFYFEWIRAVPITQPTFPIKLATAFWWGQNRLLLFFLLLSLHAYETMEIIKHELVVVVSTSSLTLDMSVC